MHVFRLWDTPGLGEGSSGNVSHRDAQHALRLLLRALGKDGGVHLLVLCMRGVARILKGMELIYNVVLRIRDEVSPKTPIVAVITEMEKQCGGTNIVGSMEEWWSSNKSMLADFGMTFYGHACLTTLTDDCHPPTLGRRAECQCLARNLLIDYSLPYSAFKGSQSNNSPSNSILLRKLTWNIIVVGETGVGRSSIINLAVGAKSAVVASDVSAVTVDTSYHDWDLLQTQKFRLWDTPGLGDGPGSLSPKYALNALQSLLTELARGTGVHLIILCFRAGRRVTGTMKQTYSTIHALRNRLCPDTPLVAVVTELERMSNPPDTLAGMDQWWQTNQGDMSNHCMAFTAHACITTIHDNDTEPPMPGRRDDCQRLVRDLIIDHALTPRSAPHQDMHIVLCGESGVGKSSLVNLLTGWPVAEASSGSVTCTLGSTEYQFQLGAVTIRLWDTVGLEEPESRTREYMNAVEKATELIRRLSVSGGITLFLFCVRGARVTTTTQSNYRLFYEVLGRKQVPIALAVTHLEREEVMEAWWGRNVKTLKHKGIDVREHVCITTLEGHPKYIQSREAVQELLWNYVDQVKFSMLSETWLGRLLSGLNKLWGFVLPKGKDLVRDLTTRCHLEPDVAQKVAACIEGRQI